MFIISVRIIFRVICSVKGLTLEEMAAQANLFFTAGFETSSSAMSFCLYEISLNPDVQSKMRKEVDEILKKHNGKLNYQALQELNYMEAVINGKAILLVCCELWGTAYCQQSSQ